MSEQREVQELVRQGIEEARLGNRDAARALLDKAVERDPLNERGWLWLSSLVESDDEKRECLKRVLEINPSNERAQRALEKLTAKEHELSGGDEVIPGVSRRTFTYAVGGGAVAVVLIVLLFIIATISNNNRLAAEQQGTQAAMVAQTAAVVMAATESAGATQTAAALFTPTPTVVIRNTQPATWTPTPTETPITGPVSLAPPVGLTGSLAGWSGRDVQNVDFLPVGVFNLATGAFSPVSSTLGRDVDFHPNGQRIIYTRYDQVLFDVLVEAINLNLTQPENLAQYWEGFPGAISPQMPSYSPDGSRVAFIGTDANTQAQQVYMVNLDPVPPDVSPLRQLTSDNVTYTFPALSPDGSKVAVVRNDLSGASPGADIVIIDIASLSQTPVTNDLGTFIETAPQWSPDGTQILYAAAPANDPTNSDIAIRNAGGFGLPSLPVRDPGNDVFPVYSPDGRYIAFSSNRNGNYDIYIYDGATETLSQLTNTAEEDYAGGWWQP